MCVVTFLCSTIDDGTACEAGIQLLCNLAIQLQNYIKLLIWQNIFFLRLLPFYNADGEAAIERHLTHPNSANGAIWTLLTLHTLFSSHRTGRNCVSVFAIWEGPFENSQ